ncbi:hypothetical protein OIU84_013732 [Salix udensis]|uniref:Uncharacterized protein n=1 Tax=Salix udensis TaxID=889485 RepID=A0AAD6NV22_9ROSI|nr:hypothetical protein OIU84_013732 [Salix udensis]
MAFIHFSCGSTLSAEKLNLKFVSLLSSFDQIVFTNGRCLNLPFLFWSGFWAGFDGRKGKKQQMEDHILRIIILGIISWTTAFHLFRKLLPKRSFEFCNRLVSTAHATFSCCSSFPVC